MATHLVSYDLISGKNYDKLHTAIKSYGTWAHIHESLWAVVSSDSAVQVRDHLLRYIDHDDRLFVVRSDGEAAWRGVLCRDAWLKENL